MQVLSKYRYQKNKFWVGVLKDAANATTFADFDLNLNNILTSLKESSKFIDESEPRRWANAVFVGDRWGIMNNNLAESWNSWIKEARTMPPLAMVDSIRVKVMKMMSERRDEGAWMNGVLCPEPDKIVQRNCLEARDVTVVVASGVLFEVFELEKRFVVDVEKRTCTCGKWQIEKLPCKHGCACIETLHQNVYDSVIHTLEWMHTGKLTAGFYTAYRTTAHIRRGGLNLILCIHRMFVDCLDGRKQKGSRRKLRAVMCGVDCVRNMVTIVARVENPAYVVSKFYHTTGLCC